MFSDKVMTNVKNGSFIRAMFEEGEKLRKIHGADKVYDFSLGNPDYEPPAPVIETMKKFIMDETPYLHRYMNNAGFPDVRQVIADSVSRDTGLPVTAGNIIMTCGAAGGLNVVLKTILNPEDEVIVFAPYFVEYGFYAGNYGGKIVVVPTDKSTFQPDLQLLENAITSKTKAVIINSPNNPTGVVYGEELLKNMAQLLERKEKDLGITIFVLSDEPYTKIVYDNAIVPDILTIFNNAVVVNSFSKSLALPGERIGYIVASPRIPQINLMMEGMVFCNRTMGFVNAPSFFQKVIAQTFNTAVNTDEYKRRRDFFHENLTSLGYSCIKPQGAFYLFPKALIEDDMEFCKRAVKYNLLIVPGSGFGMKGFFRIAYSVNFETIKNSIPAFKALAEEFK